ncbi:ATP-binding protein [Deinococcus yavapaiensis]|uniref:histidine kinase n=1 Tax=Deinococcus yavapaiensis KR-236 TaxID=694435 RepID=A0A318S9Q8_9DEIO|nr:ATP-binding protein [Deinococcus yavapaiensis]PYE53812.1 signal transduction histidine kinase [Deinococcus yavapaiensis KR-236]
MKLLTVHVQSEQDLVDARGRAKHLAGALGLGPQEQARVATVVSELARNALRYAGGGTVEFHVDTNAAPLTLSMTVSDRGPGIRQLDKVLSGTYASTTGLGVGLLGSKRLMDTFDVRARPGGGTIVEVGKRLPSDVNAADLRRAVDALARTHPVGVLGELREHNQELMGALAELAEREERLRSLNQELEETNRGVVALYAELEEKAERLREANDLKSTFLSYMSHEFRTPLHSILGLAGFLLARLDGDLTDEQHKQVTLIQGAASDLLAMVGDLLDLAKVEAGKTDVHVSTFEVGALFGTLRALFAPLVTNPDVKLVFEEPLDVPRLSTDEGKVSQVLRNFIANALKFTSHGDVRVSASYDASRGVVRFAVRDTGIGIAPGDREKLFQDFSQLRTPMMKVPRGTGLGLSIARTFTELLGGHVGVISTLGEGSEFFAVLPAVYAGIAASNVPLVLPEQDGSAVQSGTVLLVDDQASDRYLLRTLLQREGFTVQEAHHGQAGLSAARTRAHRVIVLDLNLPDVSGQEVLQALRADEATRDVPVLIVTSQPLTDALHREFQALGASAHAKERLYQGDNATFTAALRGAAARSEEGRA